MYTCLGGGCPYTHTECFNNSITKLKLSKLKLSYMVFVSSFILYLNLATSISVLIPTGQIQGTSSITSCYHCFILPEKAPQHIQMKMLCNVPSTISQMKNLCTSVNMQGPCIPGS